MDTGVSGRWHRRQRTRDLFGRFWFTRTRRTYDFVAGLRHQRQRRHDERYGETLEIQPPKGPPAQFDLNAGTHLCILRLFVAFLTPSWLHDKVRLNAKPCDFRRFLIDSSAKITWHLSCCLLVRRISFSLLCADLGMRRKG